MKALYTIPYSKTNKKGHPVLTLKEFITFVKSNKVLTKRMADFFKAPMTKRFRKFNGMINKKSAQSYYKKHIKEFGRPLKIIPITTFTSKTSIDVTVTEDGLEDIMGCDLILSMLQSFDPLLSKP